jgi:hypothetical protein
VILRPLLEAQAVRRAAYNTRQVGQKSSQIRCAGKEHLWYGIEPPLRRKGMKIHPFRLRHNRYPDGPGAVQMSHCDIDSDWTLDTNGASFGPCAMPRRMPAQSVSPADVAAEIERLCGLSLRDLRTAWAAEFRRDSPKGLWRDLLLRTLAWRLQEKAFGGHDKGDAEAPRDIWPEAGRG